MTQTRTIQASGGNATNLNGAVALLAAANPITEPWVFLVNNEILIETANVTLGNYGQTSTNTITFQPQPGEGFADLHDYTTAPLDMDASGSGGAAFRFNAGVFVFFDNQNHIVFQGLQLEWASGGLSFSGCGNNFKFQRNIIRGRPGISLSAPSCDGLIANNLFVTEADATAVAISASGAHVTYFLHNTVAQLLPGATTSVFTDNFLGFGGTVYARLFGTAAYHANTAARAYGILGAGNQAIAQSHNVSNTATDVWAMPNSSQSGNKTNDFEDMIVAAAGENCDFRPKAGGLLRGYIPAASYYDPSSTNANYAGACATDIRGVSRLTGSPNIDVGCFQRTTAAPATALITLNSDVVDSGLSDIVIHGTQVRVCSSLPTSYATALSTIARSCLRDVWGATGQRRGRWTQDSQCSDQQCRLYHGQRNGDTLGGGRHSRGWSSSSGRTGCGTASRNLWMGVQFRVLGVGLAKGIDLGHLREYVFLSAEEDCQC